MLCSRCWCLSLLVCVGCDVLLCSDMLCCVWLSLDGGGWCCV